MGVLFGKLEEAGDHRVIGRREFCLQVAVLLEPLLVGEALVGGHGAIGRNCLQVVGP
jgi:hypothetical protein